MANPADTENESQGFSNTVGEMSINEILRTSGAQDAVLNLAVDTIKKNTQDLQKVQLQRQLEESANALREYNVTSETEANKAETQKATRDFATATGSNAEDPDSLLLNLGKDYNKTMKEVGGLEDDLIKQKEAEVDQSKGFFGGINAAVYNNPTWYALDHPQTLAKMRLLEAKKQKANDLSVQMATVNRNTSEVINNQTRLTRPLSIEAQRQVAATAASVFTDKALQLKAQGINDDTAGIINVVQMDAQRLANKEKVFSIQELAQDRDFKRAQMLLVNEQRAALLADKKTSEEARFDAIQDIQTGLEVMHQGNASNKLPPDKIWNIANSKTPLGQKFMIAQAIGMRKRAFGESVISDNPGEAAEIVLNYNVPMNPEQRAMKQVLVDANADAHAGIVAGQKLTPDKVNIKDKEWVSEAVNANVAHKLKAFTSNIAAGDNSNPYQAPAPETVGQIAGVKSSVFYQKVLDAQIKNGMNYTDPQRILDMAFAGVKNKEISYSDAVNGIFLYFQGAVRMNNAVKNFGTVGFDKQTGYKTTIRTPKGSVNADVADITEINSVLSRIIAEDSSFKSGEFSGMVR